jgi:hypothetical protein
VWLISKIIEHDGLTGNLSNGDALRSSIYGRDDSLVLDLLNKFADAPRHPWMKEFARFAGLNRVGIDPDRWLVSLVIGGLNYKSHVLKLCTLAVHHMDDSG